MAQPLLRSSRLVRPMIDALFNQSNYLATKKLLDGSVLRQQAIASNIANLETPHYKRIDVARDFSTQLQQALASKDPAQIQSIQPQLAIDPSARSSRKDGNTVELEHELVQLNQNTVEHALETQLITGSLLRLRLAITGRPS